MTYTVGEGDRQRGVDLGTWWMVDVFALCSDTKWKFIFFGGGYINQLLLFICILTFSGINNFTLVSKSDMTCPMGL